MKETLTAITAEEIINQIFEGRKVFDFIRTPMDEDLTHEDYYFDLISFLNRQSFQSFKYKPFSFRNSDLSFFYAKYLNLPFTDFSGSNLTHTDLSFGCFAYSDFSNTIMINTDILESNLSYCNFKDAKFVNIQARGANLDYVRNLSNPTFDPRIPN